MTKLEQLVAYRQWCWTGSAYTTVHNGYGFIVYRHNHQMWLAGLTKKVTAEQLDVHNTKRLDPNMPVRIIGFWAPYHGSITERMFEVPATPELVSAVVLSACSELTHHDI